MKTIKYIIPILLCLSLNVAEIQAQDELKDKMDVKMNMSHIQNGKMDVTITFVIPPNSIDEDGSYTFTPIIKGKNGQETTLPKVLINGAKKAEKYYETLKYQKVEGEEGNDIPEILVNGSSKEAKKYYKLLTTRKENDLSDENFHTALRYNNKDTYTITYKTTTTYDKWMDGSDLEVLAEPNESNDGMRKEVAYFPLGKMPVSVANAGEAKTKSTKIKTHIENKEIHLTFPQSGTTVLPGYGSNSAELSDISNSIRKIQNNSSFKIINIAIKASASPEGSYDNNVRLALLRFYAFAEYLKSNFDLDSRLVQVSSTPEDWDGVLSLVMADRVLSETDKTIIQNMIKKIPDVEERKNQLKAYAGGKPYQHMLNNLYPKLRNIHCDIEYEEQEVIVYEED